jgi:Na+/H+ antiporter NhaD/arsenite permease-like protein
LHKNKEKREKYSLSVSHALKNIDIPSVLFFLGILLAVGALEATGQLNQLAVMLSNQIPNKTLLVSCIGLVSSIVDNVPLVAAAMGMYPLSEFPVNHSFWLFLSYCAGTGGSLLIIGSAAGIAAMGIGQVHFGWYLKKISWLAIIGFLAGIGVFLLQQLITG